MKKFLLAPAVAALAMFFWGFVYYGISGLPYRTLGPAADVAAALSALPDSGTYLVPDPRDGEAANAASMQTGPVAMVHLRQGPARGMGVVMAQGYLHMFVACLLLAALLAKSEPSFKGYGCRLKFSVLVGLLGTVFTHGGAAIWWQQPWAWHFANMAYDVIAWLIAGAVLAKLFTPRAASEPVSPPAA